ncbi:superoxide dismutase family protein [Comamonadaceae bacterium OH2545_COT-014]|nr:superoxide dismutase family protein [Comamonadaceae bacterium OH2545_COT-014]
MKALHLLTTVAAAALLAACSTASKPAAAPAKAAPATVALKPTSVPIAPGAKQPVQGKLRFVDTGYVVQVTGEVSGLKPGALHGFHVHEHGDCSAPDASSAGGHFNPTGAPHGAHGHGHHHIGDMPQLLADAKGVAKVSFTSHSLKLAGAHSIVGKSVIVHRDPDDPKAQPTGNSGPRVACGVIQAGQ